MTDDERDSFDLEVMAGGAQVLRERGINPGVRLATAVGTSIRGMFEILTLTERKAFFVVMATELEMMMAAEEMRAEGVTPKPN